MAWQILRTTADLTDDPDYQGLVLGDLNALTLAEMVPSGRVTGNYSQEFQGLMDVRVIWRDVADAIVPAGGALTIEPVYLDDLGDDRVFSVGDPTLATGFRPLQLIVPEVGFVSVRLTSMTGPGATTYAEVWVFAH